MTKITYTNAIDTIATYLMNFEVPEDVAIAIDRMGELKEQIAKRNAKTSGKPTKTQRVNADIKDNIANLLVGKQMQCKDVATAMGISPQKCSALLTQLVKDGRVERTQEKKSGPALFSVPEVEEGE